MFKVETKGAKAEAASSAQYHTIVSGDTLGALARKYSTSVKRLCELNGITETTILKLGKKLGIALDHLAYVVLTLTDALAVIGEPRAALLHDTEVNTDVS